jgi:6,7-dimethyl-8-ribityllumazine synthase
MSVQRKGSPAARGLRFGLIVSSFNEFATGRLLEGAEACLERHGGRAEERTVIRVPGAWELPLAAGRAASSGNFDALVVLGALIRGETPHFDVLAHAVTRELARLSVDNDLPIGFGLLTTENVDQAAARAASGSANKGWEAALAALEMVGVLSGGE